LSNDSEYKISGFCVESEFNKNKIKKFKNVPVVDFEDLEKYFPPNEYKIFIAIGNNQVRKHLYNKAKSKGYAFVNYISSYAGHWNNFNYGEHIFVSANTGIQPFSSIGNNTILISADIGHHCTIGNNVLLSHCTLAGNVKVGDDTFIGINAMIKHNITIGKNNIIGMGSNIGKNTADNEVYVEKYTRKRDISAEKLEKMILVQSKYQE
jgi:sugar O-acyltransferase (sialic acid O-acetyltransferase NeuD family)